MKLRALTRAVIGVPLLLVMVSFALTNRQPVRLGLFPLGDLPVDVPLSVALLAAMGLGFLVGGLRVWISEWGHRRVARRAEDEVRLLEAKNRELKSRSANTFVAPVA